MNELAGATTNIVRDASKTGGGMASVALSLHNALLERHLDAHLVCGLPPEHAPANLHIAGPNGRELRALAKEPISDLVHIHGLWTPFEWRAQRQARTNGARLVVSPHGALEPWAFRHKRFKKLAAWWLYQKNVLDRADLIVVNSDQEHDHLRGLRVTSPIATIPNGVDVSDQLKDTGGITQSGREKVVLSFSRLSPKKGIPDLLRAWHCLKDRRGYELHIHGFGEAAYRKLLDDCIRELGLGSDVKLLGALYGAEKWQKFQTSSIYVLPSYSENFGITIAEALMSGLPVITTRSTPWGHLAASGLGWIVDNDPTQLSYALTQALDLSPDQLSSIRKKAKNFAQQNYSWPLIADRYVASYKWVLIPALPKPDWISIS